MPPHVLRPRRVLAATTWLLLSTIGATAHAETLTPEQAVDRAAKNNSSLRAVMHDVAAAGHAVDAADATRVPTMFAGVEGQIAERFSGSRDGVSRNVDRSIGGNTGVRYTTPVGTSLEVGVQSDVSSRVTNINPATTTSVTIGPTYTGELYATARQPLLRGAGTDGVLAPLRQAQASHTQAESEREAAASQLVLDVLSAYWELWYAQQALQVQQEALALATQQLNDEKLRVDELGTSAPTDVLKFASEVATIREALLETQTSRRKAAIELGRLMRMPPASARSLVAAGAPPVPPPMPQLEQLVRAAREVSAELAAMRAQIDASRHRVIGAEDADQVQLDVLASVSMAGLWASDALPGLSLPGSRPAFTALVGLELEIPLGESRESAEAARARSELNATEARYDDRLEAMEAEVAAMHIALEAAHEQVALATETAKIAADLAEAERQRLALGTKTISDLVRAQQTQRETELRRLRTMVSRSIAHFALEQRTGSLLQRYAHAAPSEPPP